MPAEPENARPITEAPDPSVSVNRPSRKPHVVVIGAGYGGLATAGLLAKDGYQVTVVEKNEQCGGRAGMLREKGFSFDMGPSWYLQPEVFDAWFAAFGKRTADYYKLKRLDPSYRIFFSPNDIVDIAADLKTNLATFEKIEPGSAKRFERYLAEAKYKYDVSLQDFLYKEYRTVFDFFSWRVMTEGLKLHVFESFDRYARRFFRTDKLRKIVEYPVVFLGADPKMTPAVYSLLAHADYNLGVHYPLGGMNAVAVGMERVCKELGVRFRYNTPVRRIIVEHGRAAGVDTTKGIITADAVVSNADYVHTEMSLLEPKYRTYDAKYWESRVVAPSGFIIYLGVRKRLPKLKHHSLFFANDWQEHFDQIFNHPAWPERPSYYVCAPSKTDPNVAPRGCENLFVLVPVAAGLEDDDSTREAFADRVIQHLEAIAGEPFADRIAVRKVFSQRDFTERYNAFKGTALGLAHTLGQTALWRPAPRSRKLKGLIYAGQYTHPGIGVPMCVISGTLAARFVHEDLKGRPRPLAG
jgi:phytoene desaturase